MRRAPLIRRSDFPDLAPGLGRIFFYRSNSAGGAIAQPKIFLNEEVVGVSRPGGFFFVDRPPGLAGDVHDRVERGSQIPARGR